MKTKKHKIDVIVEINSTDKFCQPEKIYFNQSYNQRKRTYCKYLNTSTIKYDDFCDLFRRNLRKNKDAVSLRCKECISYDQHEDEDIQLD
jgi:hypothetical protein